MTVRDYFRTLDYIFNDLERHPFARGQGSEANAANFEAILNRAVPKTYTERTVAQTIRQTFPRNATPKYFRSTPHPSAVLLTFAKTIQNMFPNLAGEISYDKKTRRLVVTQKKKSMASQDYDQLLQSLDSGALIVDTSNDTLVAA